VASASSSGTSSSGQIDDAGASASAEDGLPLRIGARIDEFEIIDRIGEGGFSIVYLARDHSLDRTVALKEYLPPSLAARAGTVHVQPRSQRHRETFEAGLKSFINEAKLLAHFDHPSLVKVYRFWEANGTAYMVMPFYKGVTAKDAIRALPAPPDEAWLAALLAPLTEALMVIHSEHCYHRDVAPDNVLLLEGSGKPLLLDFGAARRVIGDMTQALTVILKAGYAPVEQYADVPGMKQGPWTDVYALAAMVYWAITGSTPPTSVGRMMNDAFVPLAERAAGRYSHRFVQAIDRALVVLPEKRTQTMEAFRQELGLVGAGDTDPSQPTRWHDPDATVIRVPAARGWPESSGRPHPAADTSPPIEATPTDAVQTRHTDPVVQAPRAPHHAASAGHAPATTTPTRPYRRTVVRAVFALGVTIAAAVVWWALQRPGVQTPRAVPEEAKAITSPPQATAAPRAVDAPGTGQPVVNLQPALPSATHAASDPPPPVAAEAAKTKRRQTGAANSEECNRIMQRLSVGESSPELIERLKTLKCR
jgi:serine/threonine protein kinase